MYIDTDTHYMPFRWLDYVDNSKARALMTQETRDGRVVCLRDGAVCASWPEAGWNLAERTSQMAQQGFDLQVLIPENRPLIYEVAPDVGCSLARAYNDAVADDLKGQHGFIGVAWVHLPEVQEAVKEADRAVNQLGFRAIKVLGGFDDVPSAQRNSTRSTRRSRSWASHCWCIGQPALRIPSHSIPCSSAQIVSAAPSMAS
ncbi:MAG: amidohydrolase family protein [Dehalococcoidia bacterium]|nr:amidohydrolase family protein [Dehalococcoidia bacterium]